MPAKTKSVNRHRRRVHFDHVITVHQMTEVHGD